jgi:O-methyltransferase involved in polyketide biosynthesis
MVAAARAMATRAEPPLISDPFAEPLVRAVGVDLLTRLASGELTPADIDDDAKAGMAHMADNMAVRTKFFDDFFLDATRSGITQAVILASGLDARAYRLPWPAGTVVYEVDQAVAIDLRDDWPAALRAAGFDPSHPTAWSAEGLLGYLPPDAQDRLLDTITALSAPGSRIATEFAPNVDESDEERLKERMRNVSEQWRKYGFDLDMTGLVYFGERNEAEPYLADHGWRMTGSSVRELLTLNGLPPIDDEMPFADMRYISGTLTGARNDS